MDDAQEQAGGRTERKLADREREQLLAELEESRRLFWRIADTSPDGIYVYDLDTGRNIYASARGEQMTGYTADEITALGQRFALTLWHPDDVPSLPEHRRRLRALADDEIYDSEYRLLQPDGTYRWLRSRTSVFARNRDGQVRQIVTVTQDATQRKEAEERLAYHTLLLENVDEAIVAADEQLVLTAWNRAAEEMYGWTAAEVLGRDIREVVRSEYDAGERERAYRVLAETGYFHAESIHHRKDGTAFPIEGSIIALRNAAGRVTGYIYAFHDVTERKQAEEALKKREAQLKEAQRLANLGSWEWHVATDTVTWSDELYRIWGVNPQTFGATYEDVWRLIHPNDSELFDTLVQRATQTHEPYSFEHRIIRPDGTIRILHSRGAVEVNEAGEVVRMFGTGQDVTKRKQAEEALQQAHEELERRVAQRTGQLTAANEALRQEIAQRELAEEQLQAEIGERRQAEQARQDLLGQLVSAQEEERRRIAHELHDSLGQYLTALHLGLKSVQALDGFPAPVANSIQKLRELALRIDDEVERLAFELRPPALDDLGLADALRWHVQQWSAARGIVVDLHTRGFNHERLPALVETTLYRIVQEALTNVHKHAAARHVSLIVERRHDEALAIIEDDGRGFDPEALQRRPRRLGLRGMAERAELAGGRLDVESEPGVGTTIYVHIPLPGDQDDGG